MPTIGSSPKRAESFGYAAGSAGLRRWSTLQHVAEGSASAVIAAPDHLARRGMNPLVRPRERHADAETKAGPDTALPKLPVVPLGLRYWDRGTGRDISLPMTWYGTTAAGPMCAPLYGAALRCSTAPRNTALLRTMVHVVVSLSPCHGIMFMCPHPPRTQFSLLRCTVVVIILFWALPCSFQLFHAQAWIGLGMLRSTLVTAFWSLPWL